MRDSRGFGVTAGADVPPGSQRPPLLFAVTVLAGLMVAGALLLWRTGPDGYGSVKELVDRLSSAGVNCELASEPVTTHASIMRIPFTYEDGWCRMRDEGRVFVRVYESEEAARLYHQEIIGGGASGGQWYLSDSNWEVHAPSAGAAGSIRDVISGHYSGAPGD
jgi:hypothetical protein